MATVLVTLLTQCCIGSNDGGGAHGRGRGEGGEEDKEEAEVRGVKEGVGYTKQKHHYFAGVHVFASVNKAVNYAHLYIYIMYIYIYMYVRMYI